MFTCARCNIESSDVATCTLCKRQFDFACAGITEAGFRKLGDRRNTWRCPECKSGGPSSTLGSKVSQELTPPLHWDSVQAKLNDIMENLAPLKGLIEDVKAIKQDLISLKESVDFAHDAIREYSQAMKSLESRVKVVEERTDIIPELQADIRRIEQSIREKEQWTRTNNVEIKGIPVKNNENLYNIVISISEVVGCPIKKEDLNFVARVPTQQPGVPKSIVVSFNNRYIKEDLVAAARGRKELLVKDLGMGFADDGRIFVNDHLTVYNKKLLSKAKSLAKEKNFQFIWDSKMIRGMQKMCGYRGFWLEPYIQYFQLSCHYASAKPTADVQNLPRLPVPKLKDTLDKYIKTVRPHLSDEELATTTKLIKNFASDNGVGPKLQALLEKRAEEHINWLEEWWLHTAYLEYRDPVVVYSSPGLVFPFRKFNTQNDQLKYAAKTLLAALEYKSLIDGNKIPVEMMGKSPLDMSQYKKIFGTCRIPGEPRDKLSFNSDSKHITVIHNNQIFHVDLWGEDNVLLSEDQIVQQLKSIIEMSSLPYYNSIGVLTSDNRDNWAKAYRLLSKDKMNRESLADIEKSIVVLCLDAPVGLWNCQNKDSRQNLAAAQTIHGGGPASNGGNRWFDKTVQFIVGADGVTGLTYEHSPAEGQPIAILTDYIINFIDQGKESKTASASPKKPVHLKFEMNNDVSSMIKTAKQNLEKLVNNLELNCFTYDKYGKNFIKSQKLSPDSYLQMAMQYAFYRLHKTPGAHYESAATRMYVGGRTETIRSCSVESIEFAKTMLNSQSTPKEKLVAMQRAIKAHKDYTVQALQGFGVDRHLLGLKLIAKENGIELPQLYTDAGFVKSAHMRISTSQVACKCDGFMCYGPLVPDGYATCYNPRDNDVNFATSAFVAHPDTSCDSYRTALEQSMQDMHDVILLNSQSKL